MNQEYEMKQYESQLNRWMSRATLLSEKSRVKFFSVLRFPMGGWMKDFETDSDETDDMEEEDEANEEQQHHQNAMMNPNDDNSNNSENTKKMSAQLRVAQLNELRKFYLPNICFVLIDMLNKMSHHKELLRLADLVASEHYKLYVLFEKKQMRSFLNKITNSSINLLDSNSDYLGYN
jgi:hypothetical protein